MIAALLCAAVLLAPPKPSIAQKLGIREYGPDQYDASYTVMLQNANLAGAKLPHKVATEDTAAARQREYPNFPNESIRARIARKRRLWELEYKAIEAERDQRNREASKRVLEAMMREREQP